MTRSVPGAVAALTALTALAAVLAGCVEDAGSGGGSEDGDEDEEMEEITRVELTFTPDGGGDVVSAAFSDPDGDGGMSGSSDPIVLTVGTTYALSIRFLDELKEPPEDVTEEIKEEAEQHLVLVYGDSVSGPASTGGSALVTHAYADVEYDYGPDTVGDDLPVGLSSTIEATTAGTDGELRVMLRHLPEVNGTPIKTASIPGDKAMDEPLPGEPDADVGFDLAVQ